MGGTPFCKESSFKDTAKRHGRTMLVVRDAMLAERRNSKASSDLPKKIETEKKRKRRGKPGGSRGFFVFSGVFEGGKGGSFTAH